MSHKQLIYFSPLQSTYNIQSIKDYFNQGQLIRGGKGGFTNFFTINKTQIKIVLI